MRSLSKEAEQKLIAAIEKAANYVNGGLSPNDAIIKSAAEANVPSGHINLMVHAYNTGRTTKQREQGEDTLEKSADFQLASADVVLEALYPKTVKTSAEIVRQQAVSTEYALSPAGILARRKAQQAKEASASFPMPEKKYVPYPRDEKFAVERAYSDKRAAERAQEELRRRATDAYVKAAASMDSLIEYFRTPGNMSYGDALRQVELRFGEEGVSVLKKAAVVYPTIEKQAATKADHFGHNKLYDIVDEVLNKVSAYVDAYGDYSPKKSAAVSKKTAQKFLTGSVLQDTADFSKEITLKQAWDPDKNPANPGAGSGLPSSVATLFTAEPAARAAADEERAFQETLTKNRAETAQRKLKAEIAEFEQQEAANRMDSANQQLKDMTLTQFGHSLFPITSYAPQPGTELESPFAALASKIPGIDSTISGGRELIKGWNSMARKSDPNDKGILGSAFAPAAAVGKNMGMSLSSAIGLDKKPEDVRKKHVAALSNPEHESELRGIRVKGTLHDLMINDPVISGYDPAEVASAFNDISEVTPNLIDSPGVLQAVLRKRLESGQLADFDLKQLLEMDKLRLERDKLLADTKQTEQNLI